MNSPHPGKTLSEHTSGDPYLGLIIDGSIVERKLGQGGMGSVYQARHLTLDKYVALKILPPEFSRDPKNIERFVREARSAAKLEHPNIVQVFNVGQQDTIHFISMQFVSGQSLQSHIEKAGKIPLAQALWVMKFSMQGLLFAHEHGIIHRDIKPDNIMITSSGEVKVVDFGLARSSESGNTLSTPGQIMGTPYFMSPEQCNGEPVDARSDIYSLGITFYYMLAGSRPYEGTTAVSILMQHASPAPSKMLDTQHLQIPEPLGIFIRKMMEKDPNHRYPNLSVALKELEGICKTHPPLALLSTDILPPPPRLDPSVSDMPTVIGRPMTPPSPSASATEVDPFAKKHALAKPRSMPEESATIPLAPKQQLSHLPTMNLEPSVRKEKRTILSPNPTFPQAPNLPPTPSQGGYKGGQRGISPQKKSRTGAKILGVLGVLALLGVGAIILKKQTEKWAYQKQMRWVENQASVLQQEKVVDFDAIRVLYKQFQEQYPMSQKWCEEKIQNLTEAEKIYDQKLLNDEEQQLRKQTPIDFHAIRELYQPYEEKYPAAPEWCEQQIRSLYEEELAILFPANRFTRISELLVMELRKKYPKDLYPETVIHLNSACVHFYESLDDKNWMKEIQGKELAIIQLFHHLFILDEPQFAKTLDLLRSGIKDLFEALGAQESLSATLLFLDCFALASQTPEAQFQKILQESWNKVLVVPFFNALKEPWTPLQITEFNKVLKSLKNNIRGNSFCFKYFQELEEKIIQSTQKYALDEKEKFKQKLSKTLFLNTFPRAWEALNGEKIIEEPPPNIKKSSETLPILLEKIKELDTALKSSPKTLRPRQIQAHFREQILPKLNEMKEVFEQFKNEDPSEEEKALLRQKIEDILGGLPEGMRDEIMKVMGIQKRK